MIISPFHIARNISHTFSFSITMTEVPKREARKTKDERERATRKGRRKDRKKGRQKQEKERARDSKREREERRKRTLKKLVWLIRQVIFTH